MQVDLTTVIAGAGGVLSTAITIYVAILRYAVMQRERDIDRRLQLCDTANAELSRRLSDEEKATIRQDGQIRLVEQTHDQAKTDIDEVKRAMVTKAEWEPRMTNLERTLNQVLTELRGMSTRYSGINIERQAPRPSPFPGKKDPRDPR